MLKNCATRVACVNAMGSTKREVAGNEQQKFPCMNSDLVVIVFESICANTSALCNDAVVAVIAVVVPMRHQLWSITF